MAQKTLTLLLVRHGETAWNREGRLQGWQDVPLSEAGRQQARKLAARLAQTWHISSPARAFIPGPPCAFYASDLSRALDTARILVDALAAASVMGVGEAVTALPALRERHFGEREGLTASEAQAKWGHDAADHRETGETYAQVNERMEAALQTLWDAHSAADSAKAVLIAGHGGSLRLWLCRAAGLGPNAVHHFHLDNTSLSVVRFTGPTLEKSAGRILLCNDSAHLQTL